MLLLLSPEQMKVAKPARKLEKELGHILLAPKTSPGEVRTMKHRSLKSYSCSAGAGGGKHTASLKTGAILCTEERVRTQRTSVGNAILLSAVEAFTSRSIFLQCPLSGSQIWWGFEDLGLEEGWRRRAYTVSDVNHLITSSAACLINNRLNSTLIRVLQMGMGWLEMCCQARM